MQIVTILKNMFNESYYGSCEPDICVKVNEPDHLLVELTCEYDPPSFTEALLESARSTLGFTFAEKYDDISIYGCETCDWGSSYGFALRFWN